MAAVWFKSDHHLGCLTGNLTIVLCLSVSGSFVADGVEQSLVVESEHPFQLAQFQCSPSFPGRPAMEQLCLVEAVDCRGQRPVVADAI